MTTPGPFPPSAARRPRPATDAIAVSAPLAWRRCARLEHAIAGRAAHVLVTFGPLGSYGRTILFAACSGRSYPLCRDCWDDTRQLAHRLDLPLTDHRP
jgi:hypothetical protein